MATVPGFLLSSAFQAGVQTVPVPANPALSGVQVWMQSVHFAGSSPDDLSNGVHLTFCP